MDCRSLSEKGINLSCQCHQRRNRNERPSFPFKYRAVRARRMNEAFECAERLTAMTDPEKYRNLRWNSSCGKGGFTKEHQTEDFQRTLHKTSLAWRCYTVTCHRRVTGVLRNQDPRPDIKIIFHWMMKYFTFGKYDLCILFWFSI
jgi:hypothetical protein